MMTQTMQTLATLRVLLADYIHELGAQCEHCQEDGALITVNLELPIGDGSDHVVIEHAWCCRACIVSIVATTPYLDNREPVTVYVHRVAAPAIPF